MEEETVLLYGMYFMKLNSYEWTEEKRLFPLIGSGAFPPFSNSPPPDESKVGETDFFFLAPLFSFSSPRRKKTISPFLRNFKLSPPEPRKGENGEEGGKKSFSFPSLFYTRDPPIRRKKDRKIEKQFSAFSFGIFYVHLFFLLADWVLRQDTAIDGDSLSYLDMMERSTAEEARRERERVIMEEGK